MEDHQKPSTPPFKRSTFASTTASDPTLTNRSCSSIPTDSKTAVTAVRQTGGKVEFPFNPLFPASYRAQSDPELPYQSSGKPTIKFIQHELAVERLNNIHDLLWIVGRPMPPRPLHYQRFLSREIVIIERMDMHLVWSNNQLFLKPIPRYLLDYDFWEKNLTCEQGSGAGTSQNNHASGSAEEDYHATGDNHHTQENPCQQQQLYECAIGFLLSYTALIQYESDFHIAKIENLLPEGVTWIQWGYFVNQLLEARKHVKFNQRFLYGELRLHRLNLIYQYRLGQYRGYSQWYRQRTAYFRDNLAPIVSAIIYITVALTAMQVGLATDRLGGNLYFQRASYGFTVFAILAPLLFLALVVLFFILFLLDDLVKTLVFRKKRIGDLRKEKSGD